MSILWILPSGSLIMTSYIKFPMAAVHQIWVPIHQKPLGWKGIMSSLILLNSSGTCTYWHNLSQIRACTICSTVDESSDELELGPTRRKTDMCAPKSIRKLILFYIIFFFPTSQNIPCLDLSNVEYKAHALTSYNYQKMGLILHVNQTTRSMT